MAPPRFSILVADDLGAEGLEILQQAGDVTVRTGMDEAALRDALAGQHALVVRSATKVTRGALEGADQLAVIGRAGIGVDNIDVPAATQRGIVVMNTPDAGAVTTGEHAIALMVALARRIPAADASMKSGAWDKKSFTGVELTGKTLGVVGLGNIGRVVATRGLGLGMRVIAYDPFVAAERAPQGVSMFELDELCAESDFVTIHVPKLPATEHLFDAARIARMKPGSRLVHAARGGIVDDSALLAALESGHLAGAALDVFETEPLPAEHPFRRMAQVVLTPHIGASTVEAKRNIALAMARQVVGALRDGVVLNGVNVPRIDPARADALGPFLRLTHDLAGFLRALTQGDVQSVRLTLQGPAVSDSAAPLLVSGLPAALRDRTDKPITPVNAVALAEELGVRTHVDVSTLKADFANLVRVEFLLADGSRHHASGTVLGHRHGRLIDFDGTILDAIPEPPLLVTRHADRPGVLGTIGTELGRLGINVERMQLGDPPSGELPIGIWNLQKALNDSELAAVLALEPVERAYSVR